MEVESLIRESHAEKVIDILGFQTDVGKLQFKQQLRLFTSHVETLQRRQDAIMQMRHVIEDTSVQKEIESAFKTVSEIEPEIQTFFEPSEVEKNSYDQLTFSSWEITKPLNAIPYVLLLLSYFKLYAVPGMALMTPLFMLIMPYVTLKYWYKLPLTTSQYFDMLLGMMGVNSPSQWNIKNLVQLFLALFSFAQSIIQPVQNAIHLRTINKDLLKKGEALQSLKRAVTTLISRLPEALKRESPLDIFLSSFDDPHLNFALLWDNPFCLRMTLLKVGDMEVLYRLAVSDKIQPVKILKQDAPKLVIRKGIDPFLEEETCIPFDLSLRHSILTGPNRGGKSSVLRATLISVFFAQTFGVGFYKSGGLIQLRPFDWIASGLRLEDRPGHISLFESEVQFATEILRRAKTEAKRAGLVLFDELFHSTNPPDGARTATVFLQQLWSCPNVRSLISTHVFSLAENAPPQIQRLCVPAKITEDGEIHFTYRLMPGICTVSSVDKILKEKGLLSAETSLPENRHPQKK